MATNKGKIMKTIFEEIQNDMDEVLPEIDYHR